MQFCISSGIQYSAESISFHWFGCFAFLWICCHGRHLVSWLVIVIMTCIVKLAILFG